MPNLNYDSDLINGEVNGEVKNLNDRDSNIYKAIYKNPGLRAPELLKIVKNNDPDININILRKRIALMSNLIAFLGSPKTSGYYIKK